MTDTAVDVYALLSGTGQSVNKITVWFDLGGAFMSSTQHKDRVPAGHMLLKQYHFEISKVLAAEKLAMEKKKMKELEGDLKKMEKENADLQSIIEKAKITIAETERYIQANLQNQNAKKSEIQGQSEVINTAEKTYDHFKKKKNRGK